MFFPFLIFAEPREVFDGIEARSPRLVPFLYCTLGFFIITWLGGCWNNIREGLRWWSLLGPAMAAILFVEVASHGSSMVLYTACRVFRGEKAGGPTYRRLFSLNIHCALILILGEIVNFLLVRTELMQDYNFPLPHRFPLGLDLLILGVKEPNIYLTVLLHGTSVFVLWYLVVLARGLKYVTGSGMSRSASIAATLWLIGVGAVIGIIYSAGGGTIFRVTM